MSSMCSNNENPAKKDLVLFFFNIAGGCLAFNFYFLKFGGIPSNGCRIGVLTGTGRIWLVGKTIHPGKKQTLRKLKINE